MFVAWVAFAHETATDRRSTRSHLPIRRFAMPTALRYAAQRGASFVDELKELLRIPSVSTDPAHDADVRRAATWLAGHLKKIGLHQVEQHETPRHPIITAVHRSGEDRPTVLVYGHYDVQPPDPLDLWDTPPFDPTERAGNLFARGASDDKGQLFVHVKAVESLLQTAGGLPVNLTFIVEGEEEIGSGNLRPFLETHQERLKAHVGLISDTAMFDVGLPSITYGLRGMAYVEVTLDGPSRDLHSGVYGGGVENPIHVLSRLIAGLHDEHHRVTLPGFYDRVREMDQEERRALGQLPFDEAKWLRAIGLDTPCTEAGFSVLESTWARPALDVNGIQGGYQGEGAKTVLPSRARAKISVRLVPDQHPDEVIAMLRHYLETHVPDTVAMTFRDDLYGGLPVLMDRSIAPMKAAAQALKDAFGREPVFIREGGSIPVVADFQEVLGIDTVLMGFGLHSDAIHAPNEHFGLDRFHQGIAASIRFMEELGDVDR